MTDMLNENMNEEIDVVSLTDEDGNPIDDVDVVIKDEDGKVIGNGTVHDGKVEIEVEVKSDIFHFININSNT